MLGQELELLTSHSQSIDGGCGWLVVVMEV